PVARGAHPGRGGGLLDQAGRARLPPGGAGGVPGGKQEAGESPEACLKRELTEELAANFAVGEKFDTIRWEYPDRTVVLHFFRCRLESGTIEPRESQTMAWVAPERLDEFAFPPADRELV